MPGPRPNAPEFDVYPYPTYQHMRENVPVYRAKGTRWPNSEIPLDSHLADLRLWVEPIHDSAVELRRRV